MTRFAVALGRLEDIALETVVHRIGGAGLENLRLSPAEQQLTPPGISVLLSCSPQEAAAQMRLVFPKSKKWQSAARTVASSSAAAVRQAGFELVPDPSNRFPNHARLIHPQGALGFTEANLEVLARVFHEVTGC